MQQPGSNAVHTTFQGMTGPSRHCRTHGPKSPDTATSAEHRLTAVMRTRHLGVTSGSFILERVCC